MKDTVWGTSPERLNDLANDAGKISAEQADGKGVGQNIVQNIDKINDMAYTVIKGGR